MYAVIFKAHLKTVSAAIQTDYAILASKMRSLAKEKYACTEFVCVTENEQELAISYWNSLDDINKWKADAEHLAAQKLGKEQFYQAYQVQVVEVLREYQEEL